MGRYQEAIYCYDKALQINPSVSNAQSNRQIAMKMLNGQDQVYKWKYTKINLEWNSFVWQFEIKYLKNLTLCLNLICMIIYMDLVA